MADPKFVNIGNVFDCLQEEAAEVIKAVAKIKRFGWINFNPYDKKQTPNFVKLENEINDLKHRINQVEDVIKMYKNGKVSDEISNFILIDEEM